MNDINSIIQNIVQAKKSGGNPQAIIQLLMQRNPNLQEQLQMLKNMAGNRTPQEFVTQLARQHGASEQSIQSIQSLFN